MAEIAFVCNTCGNLADSETTEQIDSLTNLIIEPKAPGGNTCKQCRRIIELWTASA